MTAAAARRRSGGKTNWGNRSGHGAFLGSAQRWCGDGADDGCLAQCAILAILRDLHEPHKGPGRVSAPAAAAETTQFVECPGDHQAERARRRTTSADAPAAARSAASAPSVGPSGAISGWAR